MFSFDSWSGHPNESIESFIGENLSIYQAQWLQNQCLALGQTRAQIFEAVVKEWLLDYPAEVYELHPGVIARLAMNDFILMLVVSNTPLSVLTASERAPPAWLSTINRDRKVARGELHQAVWSKTKRESRRKNSVCPQSQ